MSLHTFYVIISKVFASLKLPLATCSQYKYDIGLFSFMFLCKSDIIRITNKNDKEI